MIIDIWEAQFSNLKAKTMEYRSVNNIFLKTECVPIGYHGSKVKLEGVNKDVRVHV